MNREPEEYMRVRVPEHKSFVETALRQGGLPAHKADLLADFLVTNDLRGVFSHGTRLIATYSDRGYVRMLRAGELNQEPDVTTVTETPVSVLLDGDGGLGYFPAYSGSQTAIEKAKDTGIAVMASRNHGHFGAAGIYAQLALDNDLLAFVTSGHQLDLSSGDHQLKGSGRSPMAFCVPTKDADPILLDFGTMHDLYYDRSPHVEDILELAPGLVLRHAGLGAICQTWGGLLPGLNLDDRRSYQEYDGANQAAMAIFFRDDLFGEPDRFAAEVDAYVRRVSTLEPVSDFDAAMLPGGPELRRERRNRKEGVPVGPDHQEALEQLADDLDIDVPWTR